METTNWPGLPSLPRPRGDRLTPREEVEACREILGCASEPSWWPIWREYVERFNREHSVE